PVVQLALRTPTVCGSRSITRRSSAFHAGVTVGARPGAVRGGRAAIPPCRKRLSTRSTVSRLRKTMAAISATARPWWARRTIWERRRSVVLVVVSYNCRSAITWVSDKGGRVRVVAIVPFRKEEHHYTPLYYTANIFWKHLVCTRSFRSQWACSLLLLAPSVEVFACPARVVYLRYIIGNFHLQWSHVPANVETGTLSSGSVALTALQWSHVPANV